ncbi:TPA: hydrogenase expression/formation protein [bacterium]|nr:hydrogenase expression/formation protein [bacterium]
MKDILPIGKLPPDLLGSLLSSYKISDPNVIVGPKVGEDCAVIDVGGDSYLVAKTDPITFATDEIGWYLVCVSSNDIATMGAIPKWLLVTALLPEKKTTEQLVKDIFSQITNACEQFNITLCGGHTEITYGLDRPILVGQLLGQVRKDKLVTSSGAKVGDDIILTKGIAIEATSIIAREKESILLQRGYSQQYIEKAKQFLKIPGISVLKEAIIANEIGGVNAMHDPTEGGLATGLNEIAQCSQIGITIWKDKIHVFSECKSLCNEFNIDLMGVIASGALLIIADPSKSDDIIDAINQNGIQCSKIGKVTEKEKGLIIKDGLDKYPFPTYLTDEITKIFI